MSFNAAVPYGYNPQAPQTQPEILPIPVDTSVAPPNPIAGSTCGCGPTCSCDAHAPAKNCGCKPVCHCGETTTQAPTPSPKPACGCGSTCGCEASKPANNCGCKKPCGCGATGQAPKSYLQTLLDQLRALRISIPLRN